jgi:cell division protein FtsB
MARSKRRRKKPKTRFTEQSPKKIVRGLFILVVTILLIIFIFGDHGLYQLLRIRSELANTKRKIVELQAEREKIKEENARLTSDMEYIERMARERFRMAKKGEKVYKVLPKKDD